VTCKLFILNAITGSQTDKPIELRVVLLLLIQIRGLEL